MQCAELNRTELNTKLTKKVNEKKKKNSDRHTSMFLFSKSTQFILYKNVGSVRFVNVLENDHGYKTQYYWEIIMILNNSF